MVKFRIAIVDDNETDLEIIKTIIQKNTLHQIVYEFRSGIDINNQLDQIKLLVDLVIVDCHMPLLNGFDTVRLMIAKKYTGKLLCVTNGFYKNYISFLKEVGVHGFCGKQEDLLVKALEVLAKGNNYFDESDYAVWSTDCLRRNLVERDNDSSISLLNSIEIKIIKGMAKGYNSIELSSKINLSKNTIDKYKCEIYRKTKTKNDKQLLSLSFIKGIVKAEDYYS